MEHVVFFPAQDGSPAFRRTADLEEAVRLVERLRNDEGVSEASVHALTEVPLAFRAYYRVEVPAAAAQPEPAVEAPVDVPATAGSSADQPVDEVVEPVAEQVQAPAEELHVPAQHSEPEPVLASTGPQVEADGQSNGRARSLGFFA